MQLNAPGSIVSVSVVIPTFRRPQTLGVTLKRIMACSPAPAEMIVHVDAGDDETGSYLAGAHPAVRVISSPTKVGPGGGRNKLMKSATQPIVVSFDDDSFPLDDDYFRRTILLFDALPDATLIASRIIDRGAVIPEAKEEFVETVHFGGGGVAYRRQAFLENGGFVPLAMAYGLEEVDFCLRQVEARRPMYFSPWLRVFHDNDLSGHASAAVTAASIANQALLAYLRYPVGYWPIGLLQVVSRIVWCIKAHRYAGIIGGVGRIPIHIWRHREFRKTVDSAALGEFLRARRAAAEPRRLPALSKAS